jgi:hypothetical protein
LRQIGGAIGELGYRAVSDAVRRITTRFANDRSLQKEAIVASVLRGTSAQSFRKQQRSNSEAVIQESF